MSVVRSLSSLFHRGRVSVFLTMLGIYLPLALGICGMAYFFKNSIKEREYIQNGLQEAATVRAGKSAIAATMEGFERDIVFIVGHHEWQNFLGKPAPEALCNFEQDLLNLSASSRLYDQIRWLDETGMEQIRINYNEGKPSIVPADELQNKRSRNYFAAALKRERGEIEISSLDLNIEHNRVEIPYKPMLRIAAPVFDSRGNKRGIALLNAFGSKLIQRFGKATTDIAGHAMLLNREGYWLYSPQPNDNWGFMFGRKELTLARRHPSAWRRILAADSGQFEDAEGLWTFATIYPLLEAQKNFFSPSGRNLPEERGYFWKVVSRLPSETLYTNSRALDKPLAAVIAALLLLLLIGCLALAYNRFRRYQLLAELRYAKLNLEAQVEERTAQLEVEIDRLLRAEQRLHLQSAALEATANALVITDTEGFIEWANPAYVELSGYSLQESLGKRPKDLIKSGLQEQAFWEVFWQTIKGGRIWRGEVINKRRDGSLYTEEMTVTPVRDDRGEIAHFIAVKEDISQRKRMELRQHAQFELLKKTSGDVPLTALLEEIIRFIESQAPVLRCSILLADETQSVLRHGAAPSLPDTYNRLVEDLPIGEGNGSCGTACARRETVLVCDVRNDPLWATYMPLPGDMDWLHACWSTPFFDSKSRLLGTFGVYAPDPRAPSSDESDLIAYAVSLASLVVERKQANESLRQNEKKLVTILDSVEAFIYIKDTAFRYQYANRHVCKLFGKSLEEVTGKGDEAFFDAATAANLLENDRRVLEGGERIETEEVNTGKESGQTHTYLSVKLPLKGENGVIYALCGVSTDITEHIRIGAALRESEERLRLFIMYAPAALAMFDREMSYLAVSRRWMTDYGLDNGSEVIGRSHYKLFPEILDHWKAIHRRALSGEVIKNDEDRFVRFDGNIQWLRWEVRPWYATNGVVGGILIFTEDITEPKRAEIALYESEQKFRSIFENARDGIVLIDGDNSLVSNCNSEFEKQTGRTLEQLKQIRIWELRPFEKQEYAKKFYQEILAAGKGEASDLELQKPDGGIVQVEIRATAVTIGGKRYIQTITRDITQRKLKEAQILNLNRVYTVLSNINQAIVRLRDMDTLFREVCRIAVEDGGFLMAWIGLPDPVNGTLRPVVSAGMSQDYLDNVHISLNDDKHGHGPTGTAFREGHYICCNDIEHDPLMVPWRKRALELGFRASFAIPIKVKGQVRCIYNLYAGQADFFNETEIKLLEELADDIGFAMETAEADTLRRRAEVRVHQAAAVFESTREGVMVTDAGQRIIMVNRAFTEITGYTESEILGTNPSVLSSGRHDLDFYAKLWASIDATGHWQGEIWNRRKSGEVFAELLSISAVKDESGTVSGYVGVFADISKLKASESELEFLAHHDPLTRLPNRLLLLSRLTHSIEMARREDRQVALLMFDLDRFKDVNDSFGHLAGDELLKQVSSRLIARLRVVDTVSRLGGDEFTVLLEDIEHPEDAARVAESLIAALSEPWQLPHGYEVRIGASVGISLFPQHGNTAEEMLQHADAALYQAKLEGRGCFKYFSEDLTRAARARILLETRLRRAIGNNELRVFYQPQVDIVTGRIVGAEALVRWQDPQEGLIPPARFIPVAEATGLIGAIGEWVLKETCLQGKRWIDAGLPSLILAVNVSPHQFMNSDITAIVSKTLALTGFPAALLELELTESALMEREKEAVDTLNHLKTIGVRFAIDDFGTGYSSLAYLKRFPLDVLKIDKSFIDDIPDSEDDMQIAATIVAIAHTLRLKVLAEGVETVKQLAFLKENGCDFYQGYLKSPPVPADEFVKLLNEIIEKKPGD